MTRSDYAYYPKLTQKAFLIEIVRKDNGSLKQSFAFSMPPESVQIDVPQRVSVTPTFGGLFVDDYGTDVAQINISGTTGNGQIKEVYNNGTRRYMRGIDEAYYVLEDIIQYKRTLKNYDQYELRLFDLSPVAFAGEAISFFPKLSNISESSHIDGWKVVLKEGKISRSKEKPMFYSYSLSFIGVEPIGTKRYSFALGYEKSVIEGIFEAIDKIKTGAESMKKALAKYKDIMDNLKLVEEISDRCEEAIREYYKVTQGFVNTTIDGVNSVFDIASFPYDLTEDLLSAAIDLRSSVEDSAASIAEFFSQDTTGSKWDRIQTMWNDLFSIEGASSSMVSSSRSTGALARVMIAPAGSAGSTPAVNSDDPDTPATVATIHTYGYYETIATSETRFDVLSTQAYGVPDYADTLAAYNGITGDSEIVVGMTLKIPYLSPTPALQNNEVYDQGQNAYGSDILLDSNGDLSLAEYNDYAITSGMDNIGQAINLRITESAGTRVRLENYGIKNVGGGYDSFSLAVLTASIRDTLVQDPRIRSVRDFSFNIVESGLEIAFFAELEVGGIAQFTMNL